ncbi:SlyX family protein [Marinospirillum insulare]|uniref:Protein SlyX homolog n=1 Tax=Marinospirillum insulare TaxID=217169 RepID=A0ABQ5ZTQ5_9GAMM|nr:SlyX family protein [Marinospirillum insulare]GLR63364.1 hypothetical protein GCM10007878_07990 [Marinospirillum insulare]
MKQYEKRLIGLESQLAFQDDLIEQLNQQVILQQNDLLLMQKQLQLMAQRFKELEATNEQQGDQPSAEDERPPHY